MAEQKHTPGPWTYEPHGKTTALYAGRGVNSHGLRLMNLDDGDLNFEANARLIAAAPDLLLAAKRFMEFYEPCVTGCGCTADLMEQAIAKAEGR